ncbi:hypothetical protein NQ314_009900 [Rhamnusium bicolor]|uniref:RING-type domain-containing protein n=1 Tax=Rhamnusium bicolor TaxID=1586634 RepID=A0AAV8XWJ5_9CUCU|nr:hypothetical protein NQ314_009900 [Rhamnusium bicolor]
MGSTSSKFKKYLQHGDEFAAMQIYQSSPDLRKNLDPNLSYGENHNHNTALHYAAKHGMKHLLRTFLNDLGGNPNKKNGLNETVLHCACQLNQTKSFSAQERRAACVQLLLYWKGVSLNNGGREKVDLSAQDKEGNTALHWAAQTGLKKCVELLLAHGAPLFVENNDKLTPCDLAMRGSHHDIARLVGEQITLMVNEDQISNEQEVYSGLSQDLREYKDQLLVDTSDMLKIPLFTAEALLGITVSKTYIKLMIKRVSLEWSRELLLEKWMRDPVECCQLAGVQAPSSVLQHAGSIESSISAETSGDTIEIMDGDAHNILCPAYQCHILVPVELIERLVTPDMARRYLQFDIKAFVESNKSIKWCPIAGCGRGVRLPEAEQTGSSRIVNNKAVPITSHAVDCGNAHFFCWECLAYLIGEAHAPCGCKQWQEWQIKINEVKPEELKASCSGSEDAANCLCANSTFCWVCQESWKRHSSATGGYFRCNRFEAVHKADEKQGSLITEAMDRNNQMQEMSRFLHFYTRFRNHENSQKLEEPLLTSVKQKMDVLASSLGLNSGEDAGEKGTKFIEDGVRELLKARRVLCGSYVYGYYLEDDGYNKTIFEFMQNELEEVTEKLSEMIARPYLRTPKAVIVQTSALARRKRHEFVRAVAQGLIPPETPPMQRKRKKRYLDSDLTQTSAWLRDCEWPEYDTDEETDLSVTHKSFPYSRGSPNKEHQCGLLCNRSCGRSDYSMELIIALEMSRLQMIEDRMKQAQANVITPDPSSSISNNSNESADDQLKLAIQLSLQESTAAIDYFLKSLANHKIDLKSLDKFNSENDKELFFRPCKGNEDGRFQISDIHENGFAFEDVDDYEDTDVRLKRSHSTGDLCVRRNGRGTRIRMNGGDEPRYHLDSDHSSQHEDKPEDMVRRLLALPSTSVRTKQFLLLHTSYPEEDSYQGQSSVEDTTISDSMNADMESYDDEIKKTDQIAKVTECKKQTHNPFATLKAKLCSAHLPKTSYLTRIAVNKSIGLLSDGRHKKCCESSEGTSTQTDGHEGICSSVVKKFVIGSECKSEKHSPKKHQKGNCLTSNLRIKICKSPPKCKSGHPLETDSSNEYESETGIPKSPTLFISGVSISRTPEPKSPGMSLILGGRQSRSSSLSVPVPLNSCSLNISSTSLNNSNSLPAEPFTPSLVRSTTPVTSRSNLQTPSSSPSRSTKDNGKSKSASEPEREREIFPKSSTDGALSSVLHVQESNLSSDDFHEALFLLERSPKTRDSKRRKKSKKKDKDDKKEDVSSIL